MQQGIGYINGVPLRPQYSHFLQPMYGGRTNVGTGYYGARRLHHGTGFWGDVWSGVKEGAKTALGLAPMLLGLGPKPRRHRRTTRKAKTTRRHRK